MAQLLKETHRVQLLLREEERQTRRFALRHHPHPDMRERADALLHIASGKSPHWVAGHALYGARDPDTVYQWLDFYEKGGLCALSHRRHGGPHRRRL